MNHGRSPPGGMPLFCCPESSCVHMFSTRERLWHHYHATHGRLRNRACPDSHCILCNTFWCSMCEYHTFSWEALKEHRVTHFPGWQYVCQDCPFRGEVQEDLDEHRERECPFRRVRQEGVSNHQLHHVVSRNDIPWDVIKEAVNTVASTSDVPEAIVISDEEDVVVNDSAATSDSGFECIVASCGHRCATEEMLLSHTHSHIKLKIKKDEA